MDQKILTRENLIPYYHQVLLVLEKEIAEGKYATDSLVPSESQLMERFGVSRVTVRRALSELKLHGLVRSIQGQGTFVCAPRIEQELSALTGFVEDMLEINFRPSARVVKIEEVLADEKISRMLKLPDSAPVKYIERVRLANGVPLSFDITWLPEQIGRDIVTENLAILPIFSLLEDKLKITLDHANYRIESIAASEAVARNLEIPQGSPILLIERTAFSPEGTPVDYEILHYRGDSISFSLKLKRKQPPWKLEDLGRFQKI
jgi:GntR family transcriptional regulator